MLLGHGNFKPHFLYELMIRSVPLSSQERGIIYYNKENSGVRKGAVRKDAVKILNLLGDTFKAPSIKVPFSHQSSNVVMKCK